ncbi:MAG: putative RNA-dependent RNA polymerase [Trichoderma harzianum mononegavirus 2]|nr:MAG: putative RNA-dependent RNA polymerase [Trichoderma harzianum mononegavirus 2]
MSHYVPLYSGPMRVDDEDYDQDDYRDIRRFFPDTYLNSPILTTDRDSFFVEMVKKEQSQTDIGRFAKAVKLNVPDYDEYRIVNPWEYPKLYHSDWGTTLDTSVTDARNLAEEIWSATRDAIDKWCGSETEIGHVSGLFLNAVPWFHRWSMLDSIVLEIERLSATSGKQHFSFKAGASQVFACRQVVLIKYKKRKIILTYDQLLMFKDVFYSRANVFVGLEVLYNNDAELLHLIKGTMDWHELCLSTYDNPGFEILKQTESLSKAYLSHVSDKIFKEDGPYPRMVEKIRKKETSWGRKTDQLVDKFDALLRTTTNTQFITEIFGVLKVSGHPLIDPGQGGESAAKEASSQDNTTLEDAFRVANSVKRIVLENYVRKHGSWPPLKFPRISRKTKLYSLYCRQFRGLHRGSYPLEDWDYVDFGKICDFDYSANYLDLIDDKSISFYRTNIATAWDKEVTPKSERRLLLELISRADFNIKEIVDRVASRDVPLDWLIMCLYPKEREFKVEARMFCMLVLEMRVFFALCEANLADQILPYIPQLTMTSSSNQIQSKFLQMTAPITDPNILRLYYEIDLTRWNLRWRELVIHKVGDVINDMFGQSGIFTTAHWFFSRCQVIVRVPGHPPRGYKDDVIPISNLAWRKHDGGVEGIAQKLWSIATTGTLDLSMYQLDLDYEEAGQGDNHVVVIRMTKKPTFTPYETLCELRATLNKNIPEEFSKVHQEVKPEECLESTSVITYSKDVYVNGVYHPTSLKFVSRLFPHSSQVFPSIRTNIGSIFSTAVAAAEKSVNPMKCYYLAIFHSALYLYRMSSGRGIYGRQVLKFLNAYGREKFSKWIKFTLTLPSELGGFPVIPFTGFIYKGGSDPLGKSLSAMSMLAFLDHHDDNRLYNRMLAQLYSKSLYQPQPRLATLLSDPFSIPIRKPVTSMDGVTDMTLNELRSSGIVKLRDVRELMSATVDKYSEQIVNLLCAVEPCNPILLRDVLDCSVAGIVDTISGMFVSTRTLQSVVRQIGIPIVDRILRLECDGLIYLAKRFETLPPDPIQHEPIYDLTKRLRRQWYPGENRDVAGVTTYLPFDFKIDKTSTGFNKPGINAVLVARTDPYTTRGPYHPYVGSKTREKRSEHGYKIVGTDSTSQAMRKLQLIVSQTGDDDAFKTLIDAIGFSRTNVRLSEFSAVLPGVSGGTLSHRYASRAGHLAAYSMGSPNFASHCIISTDNCPPLSGGAVDYPVMLQESALVAQWVLMRSTKSYSQGGSVTLTIDHINFEPLPSVTVQGPRGVTIPIERFPNNRLAFLPDLVLRRVSGLIPHRMIPLYEDFRPSQDGRRQVLEAMFKEHLRKNSTGRAVADGAYVTHQFESMDIMEAVSNGLGIIAVAMANVSAEEAINNYLTTQSRGQDRWRADTYLMQVVPELVNIVAPLIGHPSLKTDPLVRYLRLYDSPNYQGGVARPTAKLRGYITSLAKERISGHSKDLVTRVTAVFTSHSPHAASEALFSRYTSLLHYWMCTQQVTVKTVQSFLGKTMLPWLRGQKEEEHRLTALGIVMTQQYAYLERQGQYLLSEELSELASGKKVKGYKIAMKDLLRSTRNAVIWGNIRSRIIKTPKIKPAKVNLVPFPGCTSKHKVIREGSRDLSSQRTQREDRIRIWLYRSVGRIGIGSGSAVYCWHPFGKLLAQESLLIVGVGMGAAARVALDYGCPSVLGIDLRETISLKSHRFRSYKPPLVEDCHRSDSYEQMVETFTTTGDWTDPTIAASVLRYDSGQSTVLIDIESSDHRHGLDLLTDIITMKHSGLIVLRVFTTGDESRRLSCDLTLSGFQYKLYDVDPTYIAGSRVFVISKWKRRLLVADCPCVLDSENTGIDIPIELDDVDDTNDPIREVLAETVFNLVMPSPGSTVGDILELLEDMYIEISGKYDSRASYDQWSRLCLSILALRMVSIPQDQLVPMLVLLVEERVTKIHVGPLNTDLQITWSNIAHICKVAARLRTGDHREMYLSNS